MRSLRCNRDLPDAEPCYQAAFIDDFLTVEIQQLGKGLVADRHGNAYH